MEQAANEVYRPTDRQCLGEEEGSEGGDPVLVTAFGVGCSDGGPGFSPRETCFRYRYRK